MERNWKLHTTLRGLTTLLSLAFIYPAMALAGDEVGDCYPTERSTQNYAYFNKLKSITPWYKDATGKLKGTKLKSDEMRITFMGTTNPQARRGQEEMSIFVEVGWDDAKQQPLDQFIFDCGLGVTANYQACGVGFGRMDKIFLNHLHGDHFNDLIQIYCFGPSGDRKSPLYVWGSGPSGVPNPGMTPLLDPTQFLQDNHSATPEYYDDGLTAFCEHLREMSRWHTESFAFQNTGYLSCPLPDEVQEQWGLPSLPVPVCDDTLQDANALVPIELDWRKTGLTEDGIPTGDNIAYDNDSTGARVLHYPVIHARQGSMGFKLEWLPPGASKPLTMIYSSDTKPETNSIAHAINKDEDGNPRGVDVFIHEMVPAAEIWAMKNQGLKEPGDKDDPMWATSLQRSIDVQNSSHTPQGAFGYMLSQINPRPRLTVATHFPTTNDTVSCALKSVQAHCPDIKRVGDQLVWSADLMVVRVFPDRIEQRRAVVNKYTYNPPVSTLHDDLYVPKYHTETGAPDPYAQIDRTYEIPSSEEGGLDGEDTYREDGY